MDLENMLKIKRIFTHIICSFVKRIVKYYEIIFPWLNKCEELFGFELQGYGMRRIYGF